MRKKKTKVETKKLKKTVKKARSLKTKPKVNSKEPLPPVHPWRLCPYGEHWVSTHPMHVPPSKTHPAGSITTRHQHCARNPSGKDQLYPDEIQEIARQHFSSLKNRPCSINSNFGAKESEYDNLIAGWVQYWNDILKPDEILDPNLVKALIASESSFDPTKLANRKNSNSARGLTQITNETRKLLNGGNGGKGGLKDHLITATKADLNDPNVNICSGVRWLFEKKRLASSHLKKAASWTDTVWEYKGTRVAFKKDLEKIKRIFNKFYQDYQKCGKT